MKIEVDLNNLNETATTFDSKYNEFKIQKNKKNKKRVESANKELKSRSNTRNL